MVKYFLYNIYIKYSILDIYKMEVYVRPPAYNPNSVKQRRIRVPLNKVLPPLYEVVCSDVIPSAPPIVTYNKQPISISTQTEEINENIYTKKLTLNLFTAQEQKEIIEFANYLNCDLKKYPFCLKYIISCMAEDLPSSWKEFTDNDGNIYYYNKDLNVTTWEHPLDDYYRKLIKKKIKKHKKKNKSYFCSVM